MKWLNEYASSFQDKKIPATFLIDALFFLIAYFLLAGFNILLKSRAYAISEGRTTEQLKQILLSSPELTHAMLVNLKLFLTAFFLGGILVFSLLILLYSLSRALVWHHLFGFKLTGKKYWRWNLLALAMIFPLLLFLVVSGLLKLILNSFVPSGLAGNIVVLLAGLLFALFAFSVYFSFTQKYWVWESIGQAFHLLKHQKKSLSWFLILTLLTGAVLSLILMALKINLIWLDLGLSLLFLAWMRVYFFRTVHRGNV